MKRSNLFTQLISTAITALACQFALTLASPAHGQEFSIPFRDGTIRAELVGDDTQVQVVATATKDSGRVLWQRTIASGAGNAFMFLDFKVDLAGHMYLCGYVRNAMTFGAGDNPITVQNDPVMGGSCFLTMVIVKLAPDGSALWVNTANWPNWEDSTEMALGPGGDVYALWTFDAYEGVVRPCTVRTASEEGPLYSGVTVLARFSQEGDLDWLRVYEDYVGAAGGALSVHANRVAFGMYGMYDWNAGIIARVTYDWKGNLISTEETPWNE